MIPDDLFLKLFNKLSVNNVRRKGVQEEEAVHNVDGRMKLKRKEGCSGDEEL